MTQVQPFTNEEITLLEEALSSQKAHLEVALNRASANDVQSNAFSAKIQQLELLLLKVKSFKNN